MHRVELKALWHIKSLLRKDVKVPNAPCGVESGDVSLYVYDYEEVPNAPCGVESGRGSQIS